MVRRIKDVCYFGIIEPPRCKNALRTQWRFAYESGHVNDMAPAFAAVKFKNYMRHSLLHDGRNVALFSSSREAVNRLHQFMPAHTSPIARLITNPSLMSCTGGKVESSPCPCICITTFSAPNCSLRIHTAIETKCRKSAISCAVKIIDVC